VGETPKSFRKRVYNTMYILNRAGREQKEMRVVEPNPETDWKRVWTNLHNAWTAETITAVWYAVIHDLVLTNVRLHKIRLADTPDCKECGIVDTLSHRLTECDEGKNIWEGTRQRIALIMRQYRTVSRLSGC
jgi:hypothetical protein